MSQLFFTHFSIVIPLVLIFGALLAGKATLTEIKRRKVLRVTSITLGIATLIVAITFLILLNKAQKAC